MEDRLLTNARLNEYLEAEEPVWGVLTASQIKAFRRLIDDPDPKQPGKPLSHTKERDRAKERDIDRAHRTCEKKRHAPFSAQNANGGGQCSTFTMGAEDSITPFGSNTQCGVNGPNGFQGPTGKPPICQVPE